MIKKIKNQKSKIKIIIYSLLFGLAIVLIGFSQAKAGTALDPKAAASGDKDIKFTWNKIDQATTYAVKKATVKIATVTTAEYIDSDVAEGTYSYEIIALDSAAQSIASSTIEVTKTATDVTTSAGSTNVNAPKASDIDLPASRYANIGELIEGIITWLLGFGGALAVIAIVYSGIMYITAGADQAKAETAKKNLIWAITGVVIVLLSYTILTWISNILATSP